MDPSGHREAIQTYFLSLLESGYKACYAALPSVQKGVDAEGPAWLLSVAVHLHAVRDMGSSSQPPLSLAIPEFLWILSCSSLDVSLGCVCGLPSYRSLATLNN